MVKYYTTSLDVTFMALADATRRAILAKLIERDRTVTELAEPFAISLPAVSKHLKILERAGLLSRHKEGRTFRCSLNAGPMKEALDWMTHYEQFWQKQLDALEKFMQEPNNKEED